MSQGVWRKVSRGGQTDGMTDDVDAQSDDDGGRWGEATAEGGEVAYLRHAEVGVEENPGTLRCALHTGLRKSAVALRRESANRGMTIIQPLFGGRWVMRWRHGVGKPTPC